MKVLRAFGIALVVLLCWSIVASAQEPFTPGTWTRVTNPPPSAVAHMLLLTDGCVLVNSIFFSSHPDPWYRFCPDSTGSYVNGTWSTGMNLPTGYNPLYFASAVIPSGQVIVMGGEYNNGGPPVWTNKGAIFNPKTNKWMALAAPTGWSTVGDAQSVVLPNGKFMLANCCTKDQAILTISGITKTWAATGTGKVDINDEEGWTLLPNGKVLTVDAYVQSTCCPKGSEIYDPATGAWTSAGSTVVNLVDPGSHEVGPAVLRPDGTVIYTGATTNNAIYDSSTGIWTSAPKFGGTLDIADGPAALLPNGNVLFDTSPGVFNTGSKFFEWDGTAMNATTAPPNASIDSSYVGNMVILPTGQIFFTDFSSDVEIYTPSGTPCAGCAPTISFVNATLTHGSVNNILRGRQLNGLSQGAAYGDDNQAATNWPLVRITDSSGAVVYCKTHNFSTMGVATGSTIVSTQFDIPATIALGAATLQVVTNGIPSATKAVTIN